MARLTRKKYNRTLRVPLPAGLPSLHAMLAPPAAHAFDTLRVGASLWDEKQWHAIHVPELSVASFEPAHGKESEREAYNGRCVQETFREGKLVLGEHGGFSDYFVPLAIAGTVHAVLVTGPFATARPKSGDILERWHWLTGREGHPSDPEFSHYVSLTLETLVLEGQSLGHYRRMLECFALLCASSGDAHALAAEAAAMRSKLDRLRFVDRTWDAARSMVDKRTTRSWLSPHRAYDLWEMGVSGLPNHALVSLVLGAQDESDPVDQLVRRDAFQRASVDMARQLGETVSGRVGDQGVMFLVSGKGPRVSHKLRDLADRASKLARQHGLSIRTGASSPSGDGPLSARYDEAFGAAESALLGESSFVTAKAGEQRPAFPVRQLRRQLRDVSVERPETLISRFERYLEAVGLYSGYRLDLARAHLEAGFDQASQALLPTDALEQKSFLDMCDSLDREARNASNMSELFGAYRRAVADLVAAVQHPVEAARDRSLRRAIAFIERHFAEPVTLTQVSRVAGFAPAYFCRLFKQRERMTFEQYLKHLRVERAKQLLSGTELSVERVGQISGFALRHYFHRVFKQVEGVTPLEYRNDNS